MKTASLLKARPKQDAGIRDSRLKFSQTILLHVIGATHRY